MMTVDEALNIAVIHTLSIKHGIAVSEAAEAASILADEVRRLRDEVNGLTGSLDRAESVLQNLMSFLSVNGCRTEIAPENSELRIRDGINMLVRPALERAELAEKALQEAQEQEPVAFWWIGPDGKDNGGPYRGKPSDAAIDNALNMGCEPVLLYARPVPANLVESHQIKRDSNSVEFDGIKTAPAVAVPAEWREVITELADDLSIELDMRYQSRSHYPSELRKYENEMQPVYRARALLQSTGDKK